MQVGRILMGVIGRPHGVRGLVHVHSYAADDLAGYAPLRDEQGRTWTVVWRGAGVAELRDAAGQALADRSAAERLVNLKLFVEREQLPDPAEDDFYLSDLVGMSAMDPAGANLGTIIQVHDYGAGASLEVAGQAGALLIPFTRLAVPEIDVARRTLTIVPPDEIELPLPPGENFRESGSGVAP